MHPDSLLDGIQENGLGLTTYDATISLGYPPRMMHQIWPQIDAFTLIVPTDLARCTSRGCGTGRARAHGNLARGLRVPQPSARCCIATKHCPRQLAHGHAKPILRRIVVARVE
jgi:hypothetical protein